MTKQLDAEKPPRCASFLNGRVQCRLPASHCYVGATPRTEHEYDPDEVRRAFPKWNESTVAAFSNVQSKDFGRMGQATAESLEARIFDVINEEPSTRVCQRGVDGSAGCGHETRFFFEHPDEEASGCTWEDASGKTCGHRCQRGDGSDDIAPPADYCERMGDCRRCPNPNGNCLCPHHNPESCDFSPAPPVKDGTHEFLEHPRGRFRDPKNAIGKCWEVVSMLYCGQPADAPVHKVAEPSLTNAERERKLRIALRTLATVTATSKAMREYAQATLKEVYGQSN